MNDLQQPDAPAARADSERCFILEAHTYSEGLRVKVLGQAAERPSWAPPADYVGFRDEVTLQPGDYVVEFARFLHRGRRVTWIGLFKRAVDTILGDRQNHGGVGLWLLDHDVLYGEPLLTTLRAFADAAVDGEALDAAADGFVENLPKYLQPSLGLPVPLAGWIYSPSRIAEAAIFTAAEAAAGKAWLLAADQLMRATLLPPPTPQTARALILVRQSAGENMTATAGTAISHLTAPELVKLLPKAFDTARAQVQSALSEAEAAVELGRHREAELAQATNRGVQLEQELAQQSEEIDRLHSALQASDPNQERANLHAAVRDLSQQLGALKSTVSATRSDLLAEIGSIRRRADGQRHGIAQPLGDLDSKAAPAKRKGYSQKMLILAAVAAAAMLLAAYFVVAWMQPSQAPTPLPDLTIEYPTAPPASGF